MKTTKVTRFEIIDHTKCKECQGTGMYLGGMICDECQGAGCKGREVIFWDDDKQLDVELQDDGRTLKVFVTDVEQSNVKENEYEPNNCSC